MSTRKRAGLPATKKVSTPEASKPIHVFTKAQSASLMRGFRNVLKDHGISSTNTEVTFTARGLTCTRPDGSKGIFKLLNGVFVCE